MKLLILENTSSMGLRSGEYGGRYSIRTFKSSQIQENGTKADKMLTKHFDKIGNIVFMIYFSIIHDKNTYRAWEGCALGHLVVKIMELNQQLNNSPQ
jgi:hypothetical protein